MSPLATKVLTVFGLAAIAVPAAAHAASERRDSLRAERELDAMTASLLSVTSSAGTDRRVTLNGATLFFRKTTVTGTLDDTMRGIARECASGDPATAFGIADEGADGLRDRSIRLDRVVSQAAGDDVRASLCIFEGNEEAHRVRYTLAHRRDDGSIAVTTVASTSAIPLEELFPAEGDAPGSDFEEIPRPENARRTLTAIVGRGEHAARVYESTLATSEAVASYDVRMHEAGWVTTGALADARLYRREGQSYVASFRATTDGSTIALVPFEGKPGSERRVPAH